MTANSISSILSKISADWKRSLLLLTLDSVVVSHCSSQRKQHARSSVWLRHAELSTPSLISSRPAAAACAGGSGRASSAIVGGSVHSGPAELSQPNATGIPALCGGFVVDSAAIARAGSVPARGGLQRAGRQWR